MKWKLSLGLALAASLAAAPEASAQANSGPVAANAYITFNGLDWAWASPCSPIEPSCAGFNLGGGGGGWRFASASEWAGRPAASDFLRADGNFSGSGGQMACASAWFTTDPNYTHCDYNDAAAGFVQGGPGNVGSQGYNGASEAWIVRDNVAAAPEPASIALMATGVIGVGVVVRRRNKKNQA